jgi:hypothetical protein
VEPEAIYDLGFGIFDCGFKIQNQKSSIQNQTGGKGGIRTHGTLLRFTAFPMLPIQPLLHPSKYITQIYDQMAERVGFEPTVPVKVLQFSRLVH